MRNSVYLALLLIPLVISCTHSIHAANAFSIAGVYQLISYSSATSYDYNPGGVLQAVEVDNTHINLIVKGQSRKTKINYSYANVLVTPIDDGTTDQATYQLTYNKRLIGQARIDGVSRYVVLTPSTSLRIESLEL